MCSTIQQHDTHEKNVSDTKCNTIRTHDHTSQCSICLINIEEKNKACLECGHSFHYTCLLTWNKLHNSCPLCRTQIVPTDEDTDGDADGDAEINNENDYNSDLTDDEMPELIDYSIYNEITENPIQQLTIYNTCHSEITSIHLTMNCNDCQRELIECQHCKYQFCGCDYNHDYHNGCSLFNNYDNDNGYYIYNNLCLKCFEDRDSIVMDYLYTRDVNDSNIEELVNTFEIKRIYENLYRNSTNKVNYNFIDFQDFNIFQEYVRNLFFEINDLTTLDDEIEEILNIDLNVENTTTQTNNTILDLIYFNNETTNSNNLSNINVFLNEQDLYNLSNV